MFTSRQSAQCCPPHQIIVRIKLLNLMSLSVLCDALIQCPANNINFIVWIRFVNVVFTKSFGLWVFAFSDRVRLLSFLRVLSRQIFAKTRLYAFTSISDRIFAPSCLSLFLSVFIVYRMSKVFSTVKPKTNEVDPISAEVTSALCPSKGGTNNCPKKKSETQKWKKWAKISQVRENLAKSWQRVFIQWQKWSNLLWIDLLEMWYIFIHNSKNMHTLSTCD